jgi:hypothetical protein
MDQGMLTEDQVNSAVKGFLEDVGWKHVVALSGNEHGVDVRGDHPSDARKVQVESKGGTAGRPGSARFGKPFDASQVTSHVARAVLTVMRLREKEPRNTVLIALPGDEPHLSIACSVRASLEKLSIGLLAVTDSGVRVVFGEADPT